MKTFPTLLLLAFAALPVLGQTPAASPSVAPNPATTTGKIALWVCSTPAGTYEVALRSIVSVSSCEYIVDGVARVNEVNIDTTGNMAVRFYYIEPVTPNSPIGFGQSALNKLQEVAAEAADRSGQDVWKKVMKNYPTSTHAHTIEYRVDSQDELTSIYNSAESAFRNQTPALYTVGGASSTQ